MRGQVGHQLLIALITAISRAVIARTAIGADLDGRRLRRSHYRWAISEAGARAIVEYLRRFE